MDKSLNFCVVRVHVSTGYNRVERNRRASRNGRVSILPPEIPITIRNLYVGASDQVERGRVAAGRGPIRLHDHHLPHRGRELC